MIFDSVFVSNAVVNWDRSINAFFLQIRDDSMVKLFALITEIGEIKIVLGLALAISVFLWVKRQKWPLFGMWLSLVGSSSVTYLAKMFFDRPRPMDAVILETSGSFPSGHATVVVAFYGYLAYLLFKNTTNKLYRFLIVFFAFVVAMVIGFSRLYLGVHYVSDVVAGFLVGAVGLTVSIVFVEWVSRRKANFLK